MKQAYICIEGNIGTGKTTLSKMLAEKLGARLVLEEFAENPFLERFYKDPSKYSFPLEMSFLADRYRQLKEISMEPDLFKPMIISDYSPFKSLIFARNNLGSHEFHLYREFFEIMFHNLMQPDLIVFLHRPLPEILNNIYKRGREYEQKIEIDYLLRIKESYYTYFKQNSSLEILHIDISEIDFLKYPEQFNEIESLIVNKLGLI